MLAALHPIIDGTTATAVRAIDRRLSTCCGRRYLVRPKRNEYLVADSEDLRVFDLRVKTTNHHQIAPKVLPRQSFVAHQDAPQRVAGTDLPFLAFDFTPLIRAALR